jgi:hypothetical protein
MRPRERRDSGQNDLFKARLDQIAPVLPAVCKHALIAHQRYAHRCWHKRFGLQAASLEFERQLRAISAGQAA